MQSRCLIVLCLLPWASASVAAADEPPSRRTVEVELKAEPEFIFLSKGEKERANIDKIVAPIPPEIAAAVKEWTGDIDTLGRAKGIKVTFFHSPINATYKAMSFGDTGSFKASIKIAGKVLADEETHVRYKEALSASDEKSFFVLGIYEFENARSNRKCFVVCQIEGEKPPADDEKDPVIHPTGTATWTGPIVGRTASLLDERADADAARP